MIQGIGDTESDQMVALRSRLRPRIIDGPGASEYSNEDGHNPLKWCIEVVKTCMDQSDQYFVRWGIGLLHNFLLVSWTL